MSQVLVIVESPTKARTIHRFMGPEFQILASMGHVRDLPEVSLGVDVGRRFAPQYVLTSNGKRVIKALKTAAARASDIYLATDPDREGEAIAWHLQELLQACTKARFHRVSFHEITDAAVRQAFASPGELDTRKVDAQQARRVLDRLVGYQVSPLLWKRIRKGTSAGRVQSVALRLVCERERAIQGFVPVEYWTLDATFAVVPTRELFTARLALLDGQKAQVGSADAASALARELDQASGFRVARVARTPKSQRPPPPFITSTLQQAAGNSLRMTTRQTMHTAQELYEGLELGSQGAVGLITYMRTDSVSVARAAQDAARSFIGQAYGPEFVPEKPNVFRSRKTAQEAHEAIRPTDVNRSPEAVQPFLSPVQFRLYRLIWNRFVASQMTPARQVEHTIEVAAEGTALTHAYLFRATSVATVFPGYLRVYNVGGSDSEGSDQEPTQTPRETAAKRLPEVEPGTGCEMASLARKQCFTEPPKRYTEASLVRELEQNGVGRPSTYATIVNTIQERGYVSRDRGALTPAPLGFSVNDYLVESLPDLFRVDFTAEMESQLDKVEEGETDWVEMLDSFYHTFCGWLGVRRPEATPSTDAAVALLAAFPDDLAWAPPMAGARRTFDDRKFVASLKQQATEGRKPLSDRQWAALLSLVARYVTQAPRLREVAATLGVADQVDALVRRREERQPPAAAATTQTGPAALDPTTTALLTALAGVSWEPPVKRGRRTFSDERFYTSLSEQARGGKPLSPAQQRALGNLAVRYRQQISGFEALSRDCGLGAPATATAADSAQVQPLLSLLGVIKQWAPPVKRGRRVYNDSEFAESVRQQFARKGSLSERQVKAVQKLLGRYAEQIPDYAAQAAALGLPGPKAEPEPVGTACPKCGAPLVKRTARSRPFVGCSAFPKCRYVARGSVATAGQGGAGEAGSAEPAPTQDATPTRQP